MLHEEILGQFDQYHSALKLAGSGLVERLGQALSQVGIKTHALSARVKDRESLRAKLSRPDKTYSQLWEVTDLLGLRVTTYFEDSIDQVAKLIEQSLSVHFNLSNDRTEPKDVRSFGYRSLHYVCAANLEGLPKEFRFEIQIRSILQHAWAEIEHDLGYKVSDTIPTGLRRRFSRIASLLEIADEEFVSIRKDLVAYETQLQNPGQAFPLDQVSLRALATGNLAAELDLQIAVQLGKPMQAEVFFPEYLLKMLKLAGYRNTAEVRRDLHEKRREILALVPPYFEFASKVLKLAASDLDSVLQGYSLFFLSHVAVLDSPILDQNKVTKMAQFYRELDYPHDEAAAFEVASGLIEALRHH